MMNRTEVHVCSSPPRKMRGFQPPFLQYINKMAGTSGSAFSTLGKYYTKDVSHIMIGNE